MDVFLVVLVSGKASVIAFGTVRVLKGEGGEVWFVVKDVAEVLGYAKPRNTISTHCKGASIQGVPSNGGIQEMTIIPERV